jgi:quinol monooxygenase YgiN
MFTLTSTWTIKRGKERPAIAALKRLARQVEQGEEGTLLYLVHVPDMRLESLPTPSNLEVVFFEVYKDKAAFCAHVNGPIFEGFVAKHGDLFLSTEGVCGGGEGAAKPFSTVEFLERKGGFIRPEMAGGRKRQG